ncbi:MAG: rhodanese-like domain-containing protein [Bryobacterales bacterium]|nr:rhodanese-like domain-containing protein [Bryobacteraceae bacterium]MDW8355123.1 rhodanese-like domain-containing protein [Bryobacterales bacterium]
MVRWLVAIALASAAVVGSSENKASPKKLTPEEVKTYLDSGKVFFLDVREPEEVRTLGTLPGYVNIPVSELEKRLKEIPKDKLIITA